MLCLSQCCCCVRHWPPVALAPVCCCSASHLLQALILRCSPTGFPHADAAVTRPSRPQSSPAAQLCVSRSAFYSQYPHTQNISGVRWWKRQCNGCRRLCTWNLHCVLSRLFRNMNTCLWNDRTCLTAEFLQQSGMVEAGKLSEASYFMISSFLMNGGTLEMMASVAGADRGVTCIMTPHLSFKMFNI